MKKEVIMTALLLVVMLHLQAQVEWNSDVEKISANVYEIHLQATVQSPWHLYSQHTPSGGPAATKIKFDTNPIVSISGEARESGEMQKKMEEAFGIDVLYFTNKVDFIQTVKTKGKVKTNVSGTVTYMVCNDKECLPPKSFFFKVDLK